jgi:hypothetical protein
MVLKRATKIDRELPTLRDVYEHSVRSFSPDEAAAYSMWRKMYKAYESMKENFNSEDTDAALIYFDLNPRAGPKIGITRRDRLVRHRLLNIQVPAHLVSIIENEAWVGDYVYGERPPYYMSRLIEASGV